jgi:hypothetical protein
VERRVGNWLVFLCTEFSPGVSASDGVTIRDCYTDISSESLILAYREWIASFSRMAGKYISYFLNYIRILWIGFRVYC